MQIKYYGHSCFSIEIDGKHLLFDPFITPNPFIQKDEELKEKINAETVPCDFMLISHGHFDHVADAVAIAQRTGCKVIAIWEIAEWFKKQGVTNVHPMCIGGSFNFDFGRVKTVNAVHSSGLPDGSYGGAAMGFVITLNNDVTFYFAGDTALTLDMQLIPMTCPPLNFAILPLGSNFTMDVADAVIAADFVQVETIIGCHYDTFGYIVIEDKEAAKQAFADEGKTLILPKIGGVLEWK